MTARLATTLVWTLVAASAAFWGGRVFVVAPTRPAITALAADREPTLSVLTRVLGDSEAALAHSVRSRPTASRFQLDGVMASMGAREPGIALIAVDGKMARAYRVGATIEGEVMLQAVGARSATLVPTNGAPAFVLDLLLPRSSATGKMQPAAATPAAAEVMPLPIAPDETPLAPAIDLMQGAPRTARESPSAPTTGRRQRLRGLSAAPADALQQVR